MAQSAWSTEYFDKNVGSLENSGHDPSDVHARGLDDDVVPAKSWEVISAVSSALRVATVLFSLIAVGVMASSSQVIDETASAFFVVVESLSFSVFAAYKAVVAVNAIVAFYALVQLIHTIFILALGKAYPQPVAALVIVTFVLDLVLAFMLMGASAAGAAVVAILPFFLTFTNPKAQAAVALSFVAFLFLALSSVLSARRLFHLI